MFETLMYMCTTTRWWGIKLGSIEIRATFRAKLPDDLHDTKWYVHFCCTHDNPSLAIIWRTCEFLETCTVYCARSLSLSLCSLCSIHSLEVARISVSLGLGFVPLPWNHITDWSFDMFTSKNQFLGVYQGIHAAAWPGRRTKLCILFFFFADGTWWHIM